MKAERTKRYTLYTFPSLHGSPRNFRFKFAAWLAACFAPFGTVCELRDNQTGEYLAYWV
jgi:hypothetical protein